MSVYRMFKQQSAAEKDRRASCRKPSLQFLRSKVRTVVCGDAQEGQMPSSFSLLHYTNLYKSHKLLVAVI